MKGISQAMFVAVVTLTSIPAFAQNETKVWVEEQTMLSVTEGATTVLPSIDMNVDHSFGYGLGMFAYGLASPGFSELYAGPTYAPADWIQVGVAGGLQDTGDFRAGGFLWVGCPQAYAIFLAELNAAEEYWFRGIAAWKPVEAIGVGAFVQRFAGVGPYLEATIDSPVVPITVWAAPTLVDWETSNGIKSLIGIRAHL